MRTIEVYFERRYKGPIEPLFRAKEALRERGVDLRFIPDQKPPETPSQKLIQHTLVPEGYKFNPNTFLWERADASISWARGMTNDPNVSVVGKTCKLRSWKDNNACDGRFHSSLLGVKPEPVRTIVPESCWKKIKAGPSYAAYDIMKPWWDRPTDLSPTQDKRRQAHVQFAGTVEYGRPEITKHRKGCLTALKKSKHSTRILTGRRISRPEYNKHLLRAFTVVSPWGYGELAYRDFEAIYAGCVLIKPMSDHITCWPDIMKSGEFYVPCRPDWKDLEEVVGEVIDNWEKYRPMRERALALLLKAAKPEEIAIRLIRMWPLG